MKRAIFVWLVLAMLALAAGCASPGQLTISDPWARPSLQGMNGAVYMVLANPTSQDDVLLSASSDAAVAVEMHDVVRIEPDDGLEGEQSEMAMQMVKQENIPIPAGETIIFQPGSFHVMLIGLTKDLSEGETITLRLNFEQAGEIVLTVPVEQR